MNLVSSRIAAKMLGVHAQTLRSWARSGKIKFIRTDSKQRKYDVDTYLGKQSDCAKVAYCRVSSHKQKDDLERQVDFMQKNYPDHKIVKDIGSGISYKRKGLNSLLERLLKGDKLEIVVAHKDRLARFGFDLIEFLVSKSGGKILVLDKGTKNSPEQELTSDLLTILHVFSCRMHGLRKYKVQIKKDQDLSKS